MKKGRYEKKSSDFSSYRSPFFKPTLNCQTHCCGWDAFRTITGEPPKSRFGNLTTDKHMVGALREKGVTVIPLTVSSVTNRPDLDNLVFENHVVLISQMFKKNEGSWCILYKRKIYHNCHNETEFFHMLEFLNRPILSAYILWKKEWGYKPEKNRKSKKEESEKTETEYYHLNWPGESVGYRAYSSSYNWLCSK